VVVLGDVNAGAEIVAEGSVIIWGRLRGAVHAGARGDEAAVVCALEFAPLRLQIAEEAVNLPKQRETAQAGMAFIEDGRVSISPWQSG
jgi:septum site-determining protein MinC